MIDCGAFYEEEKNAVTSFIDKHQLNLVRLLNTHGHFDHVFGAAYISEKYNVPIEFCDDERETFENAVNQMQQFLHLNVDFKLPSARKYFKDGDSLHVGNITLKVIETPGHTPGGVNFIVRLMAFSLVVTIFSVVKLDVVIYQVEMNALSFQL